MTYNIISTGSKGNAVVINGRILIDCGVPFKALEPVKKDLRLANFRKSVECKHYWCPI